MAAVVFPLPKPDMTPPETKINLVSIVHLTKMQCTQSIIMKKVWDFDGVCDDEALLIPEMNV